MYDSLNNPPRAIAQIGFGVAAAPTAPNQPASYAKTLWLYETSEDTHLQVEAAGYFTNGGSLGMQSGDIVFVSSTVANGGGVTVHAVTNVVAQSTGGSAQATGGGFYPPGAATIGSSSSGKNSSATGLVATGTTQGTALALTADINTFGTVAANTGAVLPTMNPGDEVVVFNGGLNPLALYPPVGAKINALAANAAYNIATATPTCRVVCVSPTLYLATQSA